MIEFQLDETSGVATYLQLAQQVHRALRMGMLEPGDQLPTAQQVVARLAINPNTVHKAYRELEREGLVRARPGLGTFVTRSPPGTGSGSSAWTRSSGPGRCPAGSGPSSPSPWPWLSGPGCSSSTSRSPAWTRWPGGSSCAC
jgi:DNA-binding transcriptional MocR family regulator